MEGYGIVEYLTQAQVDAGAGDALVGVRIAIVDAQAVPTGTVYESGAAGASPTQLVTGANINTVLQSAGGAGWEKAQAGAANYVITRPASGASLDLHIEVGGTLAAMLPANWAIPASGVDQLRIRNFSAIAQTFSATGYSGIVTADGNVATSGSYSIPVDTAVHITLDEDGWIQVAPMGQEVSQAELDAALLLKMPAVVTVAGNTNINALITEGDYQSDLSADAIGHPTHVNEAGEGVLRWRLRVTRISTGHCLQIYECTRNTQPPELWRRYTQYATSTLVWSAWEKLDRKIDLESLVTAFQGTPDNTHVPSEKLVKDSLDAKITKTAGTGVYAGTLPSRSNAPATITTTQGYTTSPATITVSSSLVGVVVGDRWANNGEFITITAIDRVAGTVTVTGQTFFHSAGTETLQAIGTGTQDPLYQVLAKKDVGLDNVDNTADSAKPVSTAATAALALKAPVKQPVPAYSASATYAVGDQVIEANVMYKCKTAITAGEAFTIAKWDIVGAAVVVNNTLTSTSTTEALSAAQGKALKDTADTLATTVAGKQEALVSGTDIKTVNGASLLGAGNISIAGDLPGGTSQTAYDEGLVAGTAAIDRSTVAGKTILTYTATSATTFTPPTGVTDIEYLVVAGGGGGGYAEASGRSAGGGGAGGMRTGTVAVAQQSYGVAVGAGGAAGTSGTPHGGNGTAASIGALVSTVGGGGGGNGTPATVNGNTGGSGGGGNAFSTAGSGGAGTAGEGNNGGAGDTDNEGGGGGGAGAVGGTANTTTNTGGAGGAGSASAITGTSVTYAGGGGGGALSSTTPTGTGGAGGAGGGGAGSATGAGTAGTTNTGGGGGGASAAAANGGAGGSGIVVIRFATQSRTYTALTSYADNAAAIAGGKLIGQFYRKTSDGSVQQVV